MIAARVGTVFSGCGYFKFKVSAWSNEFHRTPVRDDVRSPYSWITSAVQQQDSRSRPSLEDRMPGFLSRRWFLERRDRRVAYSRFQRRSKPPR